MSIVLVGSTSGSVTLQEPAVAGTTVLDLPAVSGTFITTTGGVTPSTAGNVLTSNGTSWVSSTPSVPSAGTGPAFFAYQSTQQNPSANTWTKVNLQTELFDTNSNFASSTFTPTVAGYYQINASANITNQSVTFERAMIIIYKNGSAYKRSSWHGTSGSTPINDVTLCISTVVFMNGTTDYLEVYARETGGGTPEIGGNADKRTSFSGCFLRIT